MERSREIVALKGNENGIVIIIDEMSDFEEIKRKLGEKCRKMNDFFEDSKLNVTFKGKPLMSDEKEALIEVIAKTAGVEVSEIHESLTEKTRVEEEIIRAIARKTSKKAAERANQNKSASASSFTNFPVSRSTPPSDPKSDTKYYMGSLRSGMCIEHKGSVVVIGDVNPGAEIRADGNIIVLGKLKGVVHAGRRGDKSAFVAALHLRPKQLILTDIITSFSVNSQKDPLPEYAYIKDGMIYVDPL